MSKKTAIRVRSKTGVPIAARRKGPLTLYERNAIHRLHAEGKSPNAIGDIIERSSDAVRNELNKMPDTTSLATSFIKHGALAAAQKVMNKGDAGQLIDVLSRPNIGVLAPNTKGGDGAGFKFEISVGVASCGAIRPDVGVVVEGSKTEVTSGQ